MKGDLDLRRSLTVLLAALLASTLLAVPTYAATPRALKYLAARGSHRISGLTLAQCRRSTGHQGQVVEWAGTVDGMAASEDGLYMFLRLANGAKVPVALDSSASFRLGTAVYVLGRVVDKSGLIHHLAPLAVAPCRDVLAAYAEVKHVHELARREAMRERARREVDVKRALAMLRNSPMLNMDARLLAGRAPGALSLTGAVQWIRSFNRSLDGASASAMAKAILYYSSVYGVDTRLALSLMAAESAFRVDAVSSAGAQGLGQLMPGTAAMLGVHDPFNVLDNIEGSLRHLATLLTHWRAAPNQWQLALASYNAGAGAVEQYGGIPPYPETINYVQTILGYYSELIHYQ